jgi:5-methylcytosine-specific restriction enzyme B
VTAADELNNDAQPRPSAYLLTWNPDHFKLGGDGAVVVGTEQRWTCHSQQPRGGDRVYLIRLGVEPRGVVATGTVTEPSREGPHWKDEAKQARYIRFRVEEFRPDASSGLLPIILLNIAIPKQRWSPQSSGIGIPAEAEQKLNELWKAGAEKHSLRQFVDWVSADPVASRREDWLLPYQETVRLAGNLRTNPEQLDDRSLEVLWRQTDNGVTSVGPGALPKEEFANSKPFLIDLTREILQRPTGATLSSVESKWRTAVSDKSLGKMRQAVIRRVFAAVAPESFTTILRESDCQKLLGLFRSQFQLTPEPSSETSDWKGLSAAITSCMNQAALDSARPLENNLALWSMVEHLGPTQDTRQKPDIAEELAIIAAANTPPTNLVLYGPPGTGKTYRVVDETIAILAPELLEGEPDRQVLKARFDAFVASGQVVFTTFHQSFSYEDFVEGLRAETDEQGQLSYKVVPGVFRTLCELVSGPSPAETSVFTVGDAFRGYVVERSTADILEIRKPKGNLLPIAMSLLNQLASLVRSGRITIEDIKQGQVFSKVSDTDLEPHLVNGYQNILPLLVEKLLSTPASKSPPVRAQTPRVLIIDEINRGNLSRIFGELITLIEASKRAGMPEAITVTLPYSKKPFTVPASVHIIGTMNTADRSLVGLDIALRRRFEFREMPPRPDLVDDVVVAGVSIGNLLRVLNERIELLLDRDHRLGHAYFLPLRQNPSIEHLGHVFRFNIVPLLQEYFFEDWQRIRWVLNDHRKPEPLQFITMPETQLEKLFGPGVTVNQQSTRWALNDSAFTNPDAYLSVLGDAV